jgi:single-stranded DNA-binding protein
MIEGTLSEPKPYQGRDGEWRASLDVRADNVRFLSAKSETNNEAGPAPQSASAGANVPNIEDDPPF